jgi:hypothetical protein
VHGRDDPVSRLPSVAEPTQRITQICKIDLVDTTTITDTEDVFIENQPTTAFNDNIFQETDDQFDYSQLFESIDEFSDDEFEDIIATIQSPEDTIELQNKTDQDALLPIHALSALDQQLAELGITRTEFYANL